MSEFKQTFNSSLGKKLIMALTGLFLCTFLIVHLGGNLLLFRNDNGYSFNVYANFLTHFPPIEVIAYILYLCIIVHSIYALVLTIKNRKARPVGYALNVRLSRPERLGSVTRPDVATSACRPARRESR